MPRWLATAGAAVVLLDAYAMALEQQILAEAFFTLALAASFFLVAGRDRGAVALAASGALLAAAATMRTAALFAVPVWALYVVWAHRRPRLIGPAALGLMLPLLAYASWHAADTGRFGLTQADGWFLYGRVGEIADCGNADVPAAARPLCDRNARDRREGAAYHIWNADGPARRTFGGMSTDPDSQARSNDALRGFARAIIRDRPGRYARAGLGRLPALLHPRGPGARQLRPRGRAAAVRPDRATQRDRAGSVVPRLRPAREPAGEAGARLPRARARPAAVDGGARDRRAAPAGARGGRVRPAPPAARRAAARCSCWRAPRLAMLLGTAATSEFVLRYLIPVVPLLVCGGVAAAADLAALAARLVPLPLRGRARGRAQPAVS